MMEFEGNVVAVSVGLWAVVLLLIWKGLIDKEFWTPQLKFVLSILMAPITYGIVYKMAG